MKTNVKFICTSLMLGVAVLFTCFTATSTIRAYQHFQQDHQRIQVGDVTTVNSWMTIPYITRVYNVPEPCFTQTLHLTDYGLIKHATLRVIADREQVPLERLITDIQHIILNYRHKQLACGPPPRTMQVTGAHLFPFSVWEGAIP